MGKVNVPINFSERTISSLSQAGNLGLNLDTRNNLLRVASVESGALAGTAGLRAGDQILAINRNWVRTPEQLASRLNTAVANEGRAWVYVFRNGARQWINLDASGASRGALGVRMRDVNGQVLLTQVTKGSAAAVAGLRAGDRVIAANGNALTAGADLAAAVQAAASGSGQLVLDIERNGVRQTLNATVRTADNVAAGANARLRQATAALKSDIGGLTGAVGAQLRARVAQLDNKVDVVSALVTQTVQAKANTVKAKATQALGAVNDLEADLVNVEQQVSAQAKPRVQATLAHVAVLKQQLTARINGTVGATENTIGAVANTAAARLSQIKSGVASLAARTDALADTATDVTRSEIAQVQAHVNGIRSDVEALPQAVAQMTHRELRQIRAKMAMLSARLDDLAARAEGAAQAQIDALHDEVVNLQVQVEAMASATVESAATLTAESQAQVNASATALVGDVNEIAAAAQGTAKTQIAQVQADAVELRKDVAALAQQTGNAARDEAEMARDKASALRVHLVDLAQAKAGYAQDRVAAALDHAAQLRAELGDLARNKVGAAVDAVEAQKAALQSRLNILETRAKALAAATTGAAKDRANQIVARTEAIRENAAERVGETAADARARLGQVRGDVRALGADLRAASGELVDELKGEAVDALRGVRATTAGLLSDINGYVSAQLENVADTLEESIENAQVNVDLSQSNRLGLTVAAADSVLTVASVTDGSFGAQAGLRPGDQVIAVNGVPVATPDELMAQLKARADAKQQGELEIRRGGQTQTIKVDLSSVSRALITASTEPLK